MSISQQIEAVYQRALLLRQRATTVPLQKELLEAALKELYFVLEELQTADEELHQQNQELAATRHEVDLERQRYRTLFELAPDSYLVTDKTGKIHHANRAAAALFSIPQESLVGKPLMVWIDKPNRLQFQQRLMDPNPTQNWQVTLTPRQAEPVTVAIATTHLKDPRSKVITILWSLRDVTQRQSMQ
ncbi:MAG: PAS domain-containing protein [Cyanobacteria bacterium P01_A01_bin.123]